MVGVMKTMVTSLKRALARTAAPSAPDPAGASVDPCLLWRLLDTYGQVWGSLLWRHCSLLWGPDVHEVLFAPSKSLCKFWQLYGAVNGDLQEGLCHTQVCCTRSPCPCNRPLLTCTSAGDTQTPKGRSGSVSVGSPGMHKVLFEPSAHLWWAWGLILNAISALLPSC